MRCMISGPQGSPIYPASAKVASPPQTDSHFYSVTVSKAGRAGASALLFWPTCRSREAVQIRDMRRRTT